MQHVIGHHVFTNLHNKDPDVHHFVQDREQEKHMPGYRNHRAQPYLEKYRKLWKFAVFFQIAATTAGISLLNVPVYLAERALNTTRIPAVAAASKARFRAACRASAACNAVMELQALGGKHARRAWADS